MPRDSSPSLGGLFDDDPAPPAPASAPVPEPIPAPEPIPVPVASSPKPVEAVLNTDTTPDGELLWEGSARLEFGTLAELLRHVQSIVKRLHPTQSYTLQAAPPSGKGFALPFYLLPETEADPSQGVLFEQEQETPADLLAQMLDDSATHEFLSGYLTNDTVRRSYVQLMKQVAASELTMRLTTRNVSHGGRLTPAHASERQSWFDDSHTKVESIVLTGELQTGTIVAGSCKILCGTDGQPYTLRVDRARALQLRGIPLAGLVRAQVERITTIHPDFDRPRVVHRLTHIERLDTPGLFG